MSDLLILDTKNEKQETSVKTPGFSVDSINDWLMSKQKIKLEHKVVFFRLLATMVGAGLSVLKAVNILERQEKNALLKKAYNNIITGIK